jgi:hypothetical protein
MTVVCHGSLKCCSKFSTGPFPVKFDCTKKPRNANIANLPATFNTDSQVSSLKFQLWRDKEDVMKAKEERNEIMSKIPLQCHSY